MRRHFHIVTDGSAIGNPGPGGWDAILASEGKRWRLSGAAQRTTAGEIELTAAIEALKSPKAGSRVILCSDSRYLIRVCCISSTVGAMGMAEQTNKSRSEQRLK
jgi:ribonuclease HI